MRKAIFLIFSLCLSPAVLLAQQQVSQSLASTVQFELLDSSTNLGKTGIAVTGITCTLVKQSNTPSSSKTTFTCAASGANTCTEVGVGLYNIGLSTTNTNTQGRMDLACQASGGFGVTRHFEVVAATSYAVNVTGNVTDGSALSALIAALPQAVWDLPTASIASADTVGLQLITYIDAAISSRLAPTVAARTLNVSATGGAGLDWVPSGTAQAGGNNTITLAAADAGTSTSYQYALIVLTGGTGQGQQAIISSYNSSTKVATILYQATSTGNWTTNPTSSTTYAIIPGRR